MTFAYCNNANFLLALVDLTHARSTTQHGLAIRRNNSPR